MTINDAILQLNELTKDNLEILRGLNDAFYTKRSNVSLEVRGQRFVIPSYLSLENKVNHLQDAFDSLVHSADRGGAWFNFDGNSRKILVDKFEYAPSLITPKWSTDVKIDKVDLFKDMLTPVPYINVSVNDLPESITQVVVKKVVPYNSDLIDKVKTYVGEGKTISYAVFKGIVESGDYKPSDYLEYDKVYDLPLRKSIGAGIYNISRIIDDRIKDDLDEELILELDSVTYRLQDGLIEENLSAGCQLTTWNGSCKLEVIEVSSSRRQVKCRVMHGSYCHLVPGDEEYGRLRFFAESEHTRLQRDKSIHVPLEEDRIVVIYISPMNSATRMHAAWGDGLLVDTDLLWVGEEKFAEYYKKNVKNIGDVLVDITSVFGDSISSVDQSILSTPPVLKDTVKVVQVNKHLNDSESVKNIRSLYSQKKKYEVDLAETVSNIANIQSTLSSISFDDASGQRSVYNAQLTDLKTKQIELVTAIDTVSNAIASAANDALVPIESAKFHVRGYVDINKYIKDTGVKPEHIIGVDIQYRYKNHQTPQANVEVIGDFLFSEWNDQKVVYRQPRLSYVDGTNRVVWEDIAGDKLVETDNNIKFNQIDIPITQAEMVDIRVRVVWSFGYPWSKVCTEWSDVLTVDFPLELVKDVQVSDIIKENARDLESNRFTSMLSNGGYTKHIEDAIQDQNLTYFHKPESISSGFYTSERRVIPLSDKLRSMDNDLVELKDMIKASATTELDVQLIIDNTIYNLLPSTSNEIHITPYSNIVVGKVASGSIYRRYSDGAAYVVGNIRITNSSNHICHLYSMFPGPREMDAERLLHSPFKRPGVYDQLIALAAKGEGLSKQKCNQFLMFRTTNPFDGSALQPTKSYTGDLADLVAKMKTGEKIWSSEERGMLVIPYLANKFDASMTSDEVNTYRLLAPGESLVVPVAILYKTTDKTGVDEVSMKMAFEVRSSLYNDPIYYEFNLNARHNQTMQDSLSSAKAQSSTTGRYSSIVR